MPLSTTLTVAISVSLVQGVHKGRRVKGVVRPICLFVLSLLGVILGFYVAPDFLRFIRGASTTDEVFFLMAAVFILNGLLMTPYFLGQTLGSVIQYWGRKVPSAGKIGG